MGLVIQICNCSCDAGVDVVFPYSADDAGISPEIEYLFCGAPSGSETCLLFCNDLFCLWLESVEDDLQHDLTGMADRADGSVVMAQLQVVFLWECDN